MERDFIVQTGNLDGQGPVNYSTDPNASGYMEVDSDGNISQVLHGGTSGAGRAEAVADATQAVADAYETPDSTEETKDETQTGQPRTYRRVVTDNKGTLDQSVEGNISGRFEQRKDIQGGITF